VPHHEEVLARAAASEKQADVILSAFGLFRMWMDEAPVRRERALALACLEEVEKQVKKDFDKAQRRFQDPRWVCGFQYSKGYIFYPIEMQEDSVKAWTTARGMRQKGSICLPKEDFESSLFSFAQKIKSGAVDGEIKTDTSLLLFNHIRATFDEIVRAH